MKPKALFTCLLLCLSTPLAAEPAPAAELNQVQHAIQAAQQDLQQKQNAQKRSQATLDKARAELQRVRNELNQINRRQKAALQELNQLHKRLNTLQTEVQATKAQVARLLSANYKNRQANAVVLFLKNADANQKSRFLQYSRYINQANDSVLKTLAAQQQELDRQEQAIKQQLQQLQELSRKQQGKLAALGKTHSQAQAESVQLNKQINSQTQKIAKLKSDERRLNQVIAAIAAREAAQRKAQAAAKQQAAKQRAQAAQQQKSQKAQASAKPSSKHTKPQQPRSTLTAEDLRLNDPEAGNRFSRLQGSLTRPSSGSISGRFGQSRSSGGTWRGLFFSGNSGVRATAEGSVSYAAPLPGYGNTVIISHSDGYLSVYTGLGSISVASGSRVQAGQNIGSSGSLPDGEQGVYFELRYRNAPINPAPWLR